VHNYTETDSEYEVVADVTVVHGSKSIFIPAGEYVDHELQIQPKKVGASTQIIAFISKNDQGYVWYTLKMTVRPPPAEDIILMSTTVRKAVAGEIKLTNPLDSPITFDIEIEGEGVFGPRQIEVQAQDTIHYTLTYAPSKGHESLLL
jgi:hypothetical protein